MKRKTQIAVHTRVRQYALRLAESGHQNCVTPSRLSHRSVESDYAQTPEPELVALARTVL